MRRVRGIRLEVRKALRDIKKVKRLTQTTDEDFAFAINEGVMEIKDIEGNVLRRIHPEMQESLNKLYGIIQRNEDTMNDLLGLKGDQRIGLGISNYSSSEISKIKGVKSSEINELVENNYGDEVVHRNNFIFI